MSILTTEMKEEILELIRDNLSIDVSCDSDYDWDRRYIKVTVSLKLPDELMNGCACKKTFSSAYDTVSDGN